MEIKLLYIFTFDSDKKIIMVTFKTLKNSYEFNDGQKHILCNFQKKNSIAIYCESDIFTV